MLCEARNWRASSVVISIIVGEVDWAAVYVVSIVLVKFENKSDRYK